MLMASASPEFRAVLFALLLLLLFYVWCSIDILLGRDGTPPPPGSSIAYRLIYAYRHNPWLTIATCVTLMMVVIYPF